MNARKIVREYVKPEVTPWYPVSINPCSDAEHIGKYEYRGPLLTQGLRRWDGARWHLQNDFGILSVDEWRGLARKPK